MFCQDDLLSSGRPPGDPSGVCCRSRYWQAVLHNSCFSMRRLHFGGATPAAHCMFCPREAQQLACRHANAYAVADMCHARFCRASDQATVMFQTVGRPPPPLLRIGWNKQDPRYLVALAAKSSSVLIIDVRRPAQPLALSQHTAPVNAFALSPTNAQHICTAGDDSRALIWDLQRVPGAQGLEPALSYRAAAEVVSLQWSALSPEHIAIAFGSQAQVLHV
jgi:hypothetical protein